MSDEPVVETTKRHADEFVARRDDLRKRNNRVVREPIGRLDKSVGKVHKGTSKKFTPTRMRNGINKYFDQCERRDVMPTIKGLTLFLKLSPGMFYTYTSYPEFREIMECARILISDWVERDIYNTPGQASGKIAYAKNLLQWSEKIETKTEHQEKGVMSVENAQHLIASLAPQLAEVLKNQHTVQQIADTTDAELVEDK